MSDRVARAAQVEISRLVAEANRLIAERDAARANAERLRRERDAGYDACTYWQREYADLRAALSVETPNQETPDG